MVATSTSTREHELMNQPAGTELRPVPEHSGSNQGRFQPGQSGNPAGKPGGARHKATRAVEALLDGEAEALTRKAIGQGQIASQHPIRQRSPLQSTFRTSRHVTARCASYRPLIVMGLQILFGGVAVPHPRNQSEWLSFPRRVLFCWRPPQLGNVRIKPS
jgi:hypothetical protein